MQKTHRNAAANSWGVGMRKDQNDVTLPYVPAREVSGLAAANSGLGMITNNLFTPT